MGVENRKGMREREREREKTMKEDLTETEGDEVRVSEGEKKLEERGDKT